VKFGKPDWPQCQLTWVTWKKHRYDLEIVNKSHQSQSGRCDLEWGLSFNKTTLFEHSSISHKRNFSNATARQIIGRAANIQWFLLWACYPDRHSTTYCLFCHSLQNKKCNRNETIHRIMTDTDKAWNFSQYVVFLLYCPEHKLIRSECNFYCNCISTYFPYAVGNIIKVLLCNCQCKR